MISNSHQGSAPTGGPPERWPPFFRLNHEQSAWLLADMEEQAALMGQALQPYGYQAKREMAAAFCEEQVAQGLIREPLDLDQVFRDFEQLRP